MNSYTEENCLNELLLIIYDNISDEGKAIMIRLLREAVERKRKESGHE